MAMFQKAPTGIFRSWMLAPTLICIVFCCLSTALAQESDQPPKKPKIILLDPGHGGRDSGAQGPENIIEKNITMAFAIAMTERLKTPYRVMLTRKDDYQVSLFDRTAMANHHRADLFISIHTGAGFRSNPRGISVFSYERNDKQDALGGFQNDVQAETSLTIQPWQQQGPHLIGKSRLFVALLKKRLLAAYQDLDVYSGAAPLVVLAGAHMPAVLIEIGHVSNPMDAKRLNDEAWISALAGHVCDAIDDFFSDDLRL
jgi:N-acetylmuramoyl-L-alanine amidase